MEQQPWRNIIGLPYVFSQEGYFIISYLAINNEGKKKRGKFHGGDRDELISTLRENGYFLLNVREKRGIFNAIIFQRYSKKELAVLSSHMYLMINAGVSISETLHIIASMEKKTEIKARLLNIYNGIIKGRELYKCLQLHKDIFPDFFIKMVQLGEYTGNLELILNSLYEYYERDNKIVSKVKSSMTYPVMVFITSLMVIMILMLKVVPQFTDTLKGLGGEMPPVTAVMLNTCAFLRENLLLLIIVLTTASVLSIRYFKTSKGRYKIHSLKLKLPFIKIIYEKILLAKFSRSLSTLLNSGFNIVRALEVCSEVTDNIVFGMKIENCVEYIKKGENLCFALSNSGINNSFLISLVKTGEETGKIEDVLNKAADYFEADLEEILKKMVSLIEPVMVIVMALIIGIFIMSIMLPIVSVMDSIK